MNELDQRILNEVKAEIDQKSEDEINIFSQLRRSFRGPFRITALFVILFQLVFAGLSIYCAYQMLQISEVGSKVEWATGTIAAVIIFGLLRLWLFMELNRLSVIREIKRSELRIALLEEKITQRD